MLRVDTSQLAEAPARRSPMMRTPTSVRSTAGSGGPASSLVSATTGGAGAGASAGAARRDGGVFSVPFGLQYQQELRHGMEVVAVAYDSFSHGVTVVDEKQVRMWEAGYQEYEKRPAHCILDLIFIPKYRLYVAVCFDLTIKLFNSQLQLLKSVFAGHTPLLCLKYNPVADNIITGGAGVLKLWQFVLSERRGDYEHQRRVVNVKEAASFKADKESWLSELCLDATKSRVYAAYENGVCVFHSETGKLLESIPRIHEKSVTAVVFYPQAQYLITASKDTTVRVWSGTPLHVFRGHTKAVTGMVYHAGINSLISCSLDATVRMYNLETFEETHKMAFDDPFHGFQLLDQSLAVTMHGKSIKVWGLNHTVTLLAAIRSPVRKVSIGYEAPDSSGARPEARYVMVLADDNSLRLLSPTSGIALTTIMPQDYNDKAIDFVLSPTHNLLYILCKDGLVYAFDTSVEPCAFVRRIKPEGAFSLSLTAQSIAIRYAEVSRSNPLAELELLMIGCDDGQIVLYDHLGECRKRFRAYPTQNLVTHVVSSPFCNVFATASMEGHIKVWFSESLAMQHTLPPEEGTEVVDLSLWSERLFFSNADGVISMLDLHSGQPHSHPMNCDHVGSASFVDTLPDVRIAASVGTDNVIRVWDMHNHLLREILMPLPVNALCFLNLRGDILVGMRGHVSFIPNSSYLPKYVLESIANHQQFDSPQAAGGRFGDDSDSSSGSESDSDSDSDAGPGSVSTAAATAPKTVRTPRTIGLAESGRLSARGRVDSIPARLRGSVKRNSPRGSTGKGAGVTREMSQLSMMTVGTTGTAGTGATSGTGGTWTPRWRRRKKQRARQRRRAEAAAQATKVTTASSMLDRYADRQPASPSKAEPSREVVVHRASEVTATAKAKVGKHFRDHMAVRVGSYEPTPETKLPVVTPAKIEPPTKREPDFTSIEDAAQALGIETARKRAPRAPSAELQLFLEVAERRKQKKRRDLANRQERLAKMAQQQQQQQQQRESGAETTTDDDSDTGGGRTRFPRIR